MCHHQIQYYFRRDPTCRQGRSRKGHVSGHATPPGRARGRAGAVQRVRARASTRDAQCCSLSAGLLRQATYTTTRLGVYNTLIEAFAQCVADAIETAPKLTDAVQQGRHGDPLLREGAVWCVAVTVVDGCHGVRCGGGGDWRSGRHAGRAGAYPHVRRRRVCAPHPPPPPHQPPPPPIKHFSLVTHTAAGCLRRSGATTAMLSMRLCAWCARRASSPSGVFAPVPC